MLAIRKTSDAPVRHEYARGVSLDIRHITITKHRELTDRAAAEGRDPEELITDYILAGWEGIGDEDGNALDITLENKKHVMNQFDIREFVWNRAQAAETVEQIKNSVTSPPPG